MERIILIGFMGAGKTTLGKELANQLNLPFLDSDALIEERTASTVSSIFLNYGELHFRQLEKEIIEQLPQKSSFVLADRKACRVRHVFHSASRHCAVARRDQTDMCLTCAHPSLWREFRSCAINNIIRRNSDSLIS